MKLKSNNNFLSRTTNTKSFFFLPQYSNLNPQKYDSFKWIIIIVKQIIAKKYERNELYLNSFLRKLIFLLEDKRLNGEGKRKYYWFKVDENIYVSRIVRKTQINQKFRGKLESELNLTFLVIFYVKNFEKTLNWTDNLGGCKEFWENPYIERTKLYKFQIWIFSDVFYGSCQQSILFCPSIFTIMTT